MNKPTPRKTYYKMLKKILALYFKDNKKWVIKLITPEMKVIYYDVVGKKPTIKQLYELEMDFFYSFYIAWKEQK